MNLFSKTNVFPVSFLLGQYSSTLRLWLFAKLLSDIGSALNTIIIATYVLNMTNSPSILGLVLSLRLGGMVFGSIATNQLSKLKGNRVVMIGADITATLVLLTMALVPSSIHYYLIFPFVTLLGFLQGIFHVALYSEVPNLVGSTGRHALNATLSALDGFGIVIGSAAAALLASLVSYEIIFAIDSITFLFSGLALLLLHRKLPKYIKTTIYHSKCNSNKLYLLKNHISNFWTKIIVTSTALLLVIVIRFNEAFGSAAHNVGFPLLSKQYDINNSAYLYGWIMASWGLGRLLSAIIVPQLYAQMEKQNKSLELHFIIMVIFTFIMFIGVFLFKPFLLIIVSAILAGMFDTATETAYYSTLQRTSEDFRMTLVSISYMAERFGLGLGMLCVGILFAKLGIPTTILLFYGSCILLAIYAVLRLTHNKV